MESLQKPLQVQNLAIVDLPPELIVNILSRLSVKSLCRFRCVSKLWLALINHPRFVKMHLAHTQREKLFMSAGDSNFFYSRKASLYSIDLESISYDVNKVDAVKIDIAAFISDLDIAAFELNHLVKWHTWCIISSSNGLLCFRLGKYFWLYNPSTRERKQVPDFNFPKHMDSGFGFSYVDSIDDYKLVILHRPGNIVDIYSLRKNSWTSIQHDFCIGYGFFRQLGFPLNGAIHWDSYYVDYDLNPDTFDRVIIAFDLVEENFKTLQLPEFFGLGQFFGLFKGYLSFFDRNKDTYRFWVMKEYGVVASWTIILTVNSPCFLRPLCYLKNSNTMMLNRDYGYNQELVFYNPKCLKFKKIEVNGSREFYVNSHIEYVESLVSLNYENHFRTEDKLLEYWF
ncbi:hypothetical protein EZV62_011730 [Acer yangbiense]|uniref:F-box domain-containing protein n=1 Tax=Acer yangbiense TaxID=1000413 RepID=A0A5C7I8H2_9ROSI|nr:hypothetical protein EZV62_011730 [Acer yangbiense]